MLLSRSISKRSSASDGSQTSTSKSKSKKSYLVQGKYDSLFGFFIYTLAYTLSIEFFDSSTKVGVLDVDKNIFQYLICYMLVGIPLYYMLMILGQYCQMSMAYFKHMIPFGHGILYTTLLVVFLYTIDNSMYMADFCLYFLVAWQNSLPWMKCSENDIKSSWGKCFSGTSEDNSQCHENCLGNDTYSSSYLYYMGVFLSIRPNEIEYYKADFANYARVIALVAAWTIIFIFVAIIYQRKPKVLLFLVIKFYVFIILLNMGTTLTTGGITGVRRFFHANWKHLTSMMAWSRCITRTVKDLRLSHAFIVLNGSRMKAKTNTGIVTVSLCLIILVTSILATMFFHSCVGLIARKAHMNIDNLRNTGQQYELLRLFILVPQSLGYLAVPQIWCLLYFSCMITIILANQITFINTIISTLADLCPSVKRYQTYITFGYSVFAFIFAVGTIGESNFKFRSYFKATISTCLEMINISFISTLVFWIYGVRRLSDDIDFMIGSQPTKFWKITWYLMPPVTMLTSYYEYNFYVNQKKPSSIRKFYVHIFSFLFMGPVPILILIEIFRHMKSRNLVGLFRPTYMWGPSDPEERHKRVSFNPRQETTYQSKTTSCEHNCLLSSKILKNLVEPEARCTDNYLNIEHNKSKVFNFN